MTSTPAPLPAVVPLDVPRVLDVPGGEPLPVVAVDPLSLSCAACGADAGTECDPSCLPTPGDGSVVTAAYGPR